MNKGPKPWFDRILLSLLVLFTPVFLMGSVVLVQRVLCPVQVNQGEAFNVEFARILYKAGSVYADPAQGPYLHAAYPPLYPILQGLLSKALPGPWIPGRLLSLAGYWGCALLLFLGGWKEWGRSTAAVLALLFLLSPTWAAWGSMVRIDSLTVFLEFGAFLLLARVEKGGLKEKEERSRLLGAGLLTSAALLCKQNAAMLVLAYAVNCLVLKKGKRFLLFGAAAAAPALAAGLWLQWVSDGFYFKQTIQWISYGYQPQLLFHYLKNSFAPECGWLLAAAALTWGLRKTPLLIRCQLSLAVLALLGLGRKTSAENYFLEFILYGLFFLGAGWAGSGGPRARLKRGAVFLACLASGFICFNLRPWPDTPPAAVVQMKMELAELYRGSGEHLALDLDLPLMAGKRLWIQPAEYTALVEKGHWSADPLLGDIRARKFSTIELYDIPRQYLLPPSVVEAVEGHYRVGFRKFGRKWYVPR